jgi:hypothetical protein
MTLWCSTERMDQILFLELKSSNHKYNISLDKVLSAKSPVHFITCNIKAQMYLGFNVKY